MWMLAKTDVTQLKKAREQLSYCYSVFITDYHYWLSSTDAEFNSLSAHVSVELIEWIEGLKIAENEYTQMKGGEICDFY